MGIAAKDWWGNIITTRASPVKASYDASVLEAIAIRETLKKAVVENWASIVVLSDCKHVVEKIHQAPKSISPLDTIVQDTRTLSHSFWQCSFSFIKRELKLGGRISSLCGLRMLHTKIS